MLMVLNTNTGEPRVAVPMSVTEMVEVASSVINTALSDRIICAIGMLDEDAARMVSDDRAWIDRDNNGGSDG